MSSRRSGAIAAPWATPTKRSSAPCSFIRISTTARSTGCGCIRRRNPMPEGTIMSQYGNCRYDITLQPISGKAIPLYQGEVLRIIQVGGEQCVDFNCFNLHDYKERMSVG